MMSLKIFFLLTVFVFVCCQSQSIRINLKEVSIDTLENTGLTLPAIREYLNARSVHHREYSSKPRFPTSVGVWNADYYPVFICGVPGTMNVDTLIVSTPTKIVFRWLAADTTLRFVEDSIAQLGSNESGFYRWSHKQLFDTLKARLGRIYGNAYPELMMERVVPILNGEMRMTNDSNVGIYISHPLSDNK